MFGDGGSRDSAQTLISAASSSGTRLSSRLWDRRDSMKQSRLQHTLKLSLFMGSIMFRLSTENVVSNASIVFLFQEQRRLSLILHCSPSFTLQQ